MTKLEAHEIVNAACNYATSALVTKEGELYMFGKDTTHTDSTTGECQAFFFLFTEETL